jgi:hypothetical protein
VVDLPRGRQLGVGRGRSGWFRRASSPHGPAKWPERAGVPIDERGLARAASGAIARSASSAGSSFVAERLDAPHASDAIRSRAP